MRLLLSSVFGPFGVDDEFGRRDNKMELFHNQVTREQGLFSYRFHHSSFGLHFLAENLETPTTVLDFPTRRRFREEVAKGYDYVGISFIIPNLKKAQEMARIVREVAPRTRIILGGHGTNTPGVERLVAHDHICRGEGVAFLRRLLGESRERPYRHPVLHSSLERRVMGVPIPDGSAVLIPGVGCANHCRFCATSAFFHDYTPYLRTGREIYDVCCEAERRLGVTDFGILDENFLKMPERARELIEHMERGGKRFTFGIFSSAETLRALGDLDLLVRLGVTFVWMGVESKREVYEKNRGTDFPSLVAELRRRGVSVMASLILFLEHHTKESIGEDIDFVTGLEADYVQFMELGPIPGTPLYEAYAAGGKLLPDVPWEEQHGQDRIWFRHPAFAPEETPRILRGAFAHEYAANGASFLRMIDTNLRGYRYCRDHADPRVRRRAEYFRANAQDLRAFLPAAVRHSENLRTTTLARALEAAHDAALGSAPALARARAVAVSGLALVEAARLRFLGDARQPRTRLTRYHWETARLALPAPRSLALPLAPA